MSVTQNLESRTPLRELAAEAVARYRDPQRERDLHLFDFFADRDGAEVFVTVLEMADRYGLPVLLTWARNRAAIGREIR